jgi:hypothetical protein
MSNGRVYLLALLACGISAGTIAGVYANRRSDFMVISLINLCVMTGVPIMGGIVLGVRGSKPTMRACLLAGWIGGTGALSAAWSFILRDFAGLGAIGPWLALTMAWGGGLLCASVGLIIGSHIDPKPPPLHLCHRCGYDRSGLENGVLCPECGA